MAYGLQTYQDTIRKEDLVDYISNVDYKTTPLYNGLGSTTAYNTLHKNGHLCK